MSGASLPASDDGTAVLARAAALVDAGRARDALDLLAGLGDTAGAELQRARALEQLGHFADALASARRAVDAAPDDDRALRLFAVVAVRAGQPAAGLDAAERARDLAPMLWQTHYAVAFAAASVGGRKRLGANIAISEALRLAPGRSEVHALHGNLLIRAGRWADAVEAFDRALRIDPANTAAQHDRAVARLGGGHDGESASRFGRIVAADPTNRRALGNAIAATLGAITRVGLAVASMVVFAGLAALGRIDPGLGVTPSVMAVFAAVVAAAGSLVVVRFLVASSPGALRLLRSVGRAEPSVAMTAGALLVAGVAGVVAVFVPVPTPLQLSLIAAAALLVAVAVVFQRRARSTVRTLTAPTPRTTAPHTGSRKVSP